MTTRRGREAALRIQLLIEEFSPSELSDGLSLVGAANGEDLVEFLIRRSSPSQNRRGPAIRKGKEDTEDTMATLKRADPNKYEALRDFEMRLRHGILLPTLESCRAFGKDLSKDFHAGKSRKDCIGRLIATLATMSEDEINAAISRAPSYTDRNSAEPFHRLATHIISGSSSR